MAPLEGEVPPDPTAMRPSSFPAASVHPAAREGARQAPLRSDGDAPHAGPNEPC